MLRSKIRRRCPLCGSKLIVSDLYQVSFDYTITKSGHISRNHKTSSPMSMEASIAACENAPEKCTAYWDTDSFMIDERGRFIDFKYAEEVKE